MKSKNMSIFTNGIIKENPVLRLMLGTCPTLAVTTAAINGIGMGVAATIVLICSNLVISLLRNFIPDKVRIPAFITVIAGFVSVVQMLVKAFTPALDEALGVFLPPISVSVAVKPMPMPKPSSTLGNTGFLEANISARAKMMQLTTMSGKNTPNASSRAGVKAFTSI